MALTVLQTNLHWKRWGRCVDENDWTMVNARLSPEAQRTRGLSIYHKLVWKTAEQLALQQHRGVTAEDLRHASYLVATSKVPGWGASARPVDSMKDLGNREFSRWLVLIALLIDPDDLGATIEWEHPEESARKTLIASLKKACPDANLRAISANAFDTRDWETLNPSQLTWLRRQVGDQAKRWGRVREAVSGEPPRAKGNQPF